MIAARSGISILGRTSWRRVVIATDWNRVLIEAYGRHLKHEPDSVGQVCGNCIRDVLLEQEPW